MFYINHADMENSNKELKDIDEKIRALNAKKLAIRRTRYEGNGFCPEILRKERESKGFNSYRSFAEAIRAVGMNKASPAHVSKWEHGAIPSGPYLQAIARVLKKPVAFFFNK